MSVSSLLQKKNDNWEIGFTTNLYLYISFFFSAFRKWEAQITYGLTQFHVDTRRQNWGSFGNTVKDRSKNERLYTSTREKKKRTENICKNHEHAIIIRKWYTLEKLCVLLLSKRWMSDKFGTRLFGWNSFALQCFATLSVYVRVTIKQ